MPAARDGNGYGKGSAVRSKGPSAAIRKGASGFLMRSAGTHNHRVPHTGITRYDGGLTPVPSAALSIPDADQLARLLARGPVSVRLAVDAGWDGQYTSQNVIGEITGRSRPKEVVLIGGHLDSWDLGTGAVDDAAGIGITMAAAKLIAQLPRRPARSIRVVAFANEEQGLHGGKAYAKAHAAELAKHALVSESDLGAGRIYGFDAGNIDDGAKDAVQQIAKALKPLGIEWRPGEGDPESDVGPFAGMGAAWAWLGHDATGYFDLHHTPDDTMDKIDPEVLKAPYGEIVDLTLAKPDADVIFTWNGTTSGVRVPNGDWIADDRTGLTIADATSAVFAMDMPWDKLDVTTFSWQKVMGGEAAHGVIILGPRAVERLESYTPAWPLPKVFRLTKGGKLVEGVFKGETINTPSMLAVEDAIVALEWAQGIGGADGLIARSNANAEALDKIVAERDWLGHLAADPASRSKTSVCLTVAGADEALIKAMASALEKESAAFDVAGYRDAPAGLRIWCGATVDTADIEALGPWLDWAYATAKAA